MPQLASKEIRQLAWNALSEGQYWRYVGGYFVLSLIYGAIVVLGILLFIVPAAVLAFANGEAKELSQTGALDMLFQISAQYWPMFLAGCFAVAPFLYGFGYFTWSCTKMSVETTNRSLRFEHCFSGWGHGWKMCWTMIVLMTYAQLWMLLLVVPGIIKLFSYFLTPYVQVEHPDWTANQCITESRRLMDGNKWRLFCLGFSFIGWLLLTFVVSCVPIAGNLAGFFISPYYFAALACFYNEAKREKSLVVA